MRLFATRKPMFVLEFDDALLTLNVKAPSCEPLSQLPLKKYRPNILFLRCCLVFVESDEAAKYAARFVKVSYPFAKFPMRNISE